MSNPIKVDELDVVGGLFGFRLLSNNQVALYIEDDENYFLKATFSRDWLPDLLASTSRMIYTLENDFQKKD